MNEYYMLQIFTLIGLLATVFPTVSALVDVRPRQRVADDNVRLGDLFTGIDGHTQKIVEKAPPPGGSKIYTFHELVKIAKKFDLKWEPLLDTARAHVLRASFQVDQKQLRMQIYEALHKKHPTIFPEEAHAIVLDQGADRIFLPGEKKLSETKHVLRMGKITLNPQQSRFTIDVSTPYSTTHVEGHRVKQRKIPVLRHPMHHGQIITLIDTELMTTAVKDIGRAQIIDRDNVIGKTVNVGKIHPFKPLYAHEIGWEFSVHAGDPVRMFPRLPDTNESQPGTALMDGMRDDVILVRNENTGTIHEAHIMSEARVNLLQTPPHKPSEGAAILPADKTDEETDETPQQETETE